ncbi:MAG TPA: sigma-70 family RNA polymerase sigma factor, partial [Solirubrobacteraceae bacterium]|nr:sigma-70 family RNA polymerase sigma factor [Solirubrobacteraceae bacterium]
MSPRISIRLLAAQSDQRLAALAGEGHERAFEALVQRYRRPLLRYCRRMQLADARAEDVLQQALLQAWMAFARGADVREVRPWLYRIVHNAAVNAMRGNADGHSELTEAMQAKAALAHESDLQRTMAVRDALSDVAALPQLQQQAIFLTAVDGQSHDEVASVLGVSEGAVRGLLYRARTTLRGAAAALTPPPLLAWAAGGVGTAGPTAERVAELSAGGGAAGLTGLLLKGAVVAVTAGAVATGAPFVNSTGVGAKASAQQSSLDRTGLHRSTDAGRSTAAGAPSGLLAITRARSNDPHRGSHADGRHGRDSETRGRREDRSTGSGSDGRGPRDRRDTSAGRDVSEGAGGGSSGGSGSVDGRVGSGGARVGGGSDAGGSDGSGGSGSGSGKMGTDLARSAPVQSTSADDGTTSAS